MSVISATTAKRPGGQAGDNCPRCKKPVVDPKGLGWCQSCGYCRSLEEGPKHVAPAEPAAPTHLTATASAIVEMPLWFWIVLIGTLLIAGSAFVCGLRFTFKPLNRALITTGITVAGLALMFIGQVIALIRIGPEDSSMHFFDVIMPFRLYGLVLKRLPATQLTLYFAVWGVAAIISANVFIGGLDHWMNFLPGRNKNKVIPVKLHTTPRAWADG